MLPIYEVVKNIKIKVYRELKETIYLCDGNKKIQKEFLIQDPDGYLLRFAEQ